MNSKKWKLSLINTFGILGYFSIILQWSWSAITLGHPLLTSNQFFLPQNTAPVVHKSIDFGSLTPFVTLIIIFITLLIIALTVLTLIRLPKTVGQSGSRATKAIAHQVVVHTTLYKEAPTKKKALLSYRVAWIIKIIAIIIPLALTFFTPSIDNLDSTIIISIGLVSALFSSFYFAIQFALSRIFRIRHAKLW